MYNIIFIFLIQYTIMKCSKFILLDLYLVNPGNINIAKKTGHRRILRIVTFGFLEQAA